MPFATPKMYYGDMNYRSNNAWCEKNPLATKNLLEDTDGLRRTPF